MMKLPGFNLVLLLPLLLLNFLAACSHRYDPDTLDLGFYQWNLWYDTSAESVQKGPSCGWEDLHRGMGKLVRIPAMASDHFQEKKDKGVLWFHCRFTLPENWEDRKIGLQINGAAPEVELYLNEDQIADFHGDEAVYELDVSDIIFYTRDNHLALMIRTSPGTDWDREGISGGVLIKSIPAETDIAGNKNN